MVRAGADHVGEVNLSCRRMVTLIFPLKLRNSFSFFFFFLFSFLFFLQQEASLHKRRKSSEKPVNPEKRHSYPTFSQPEAEVVRYIPVYPPSSIIIKSQRHKFFFFFTIFRGCFDQCLGILCSHSMMLSFHMRAFKIEDGIKLIPPRATFRRTQKNGDGGCS